MFRAGLAEWRDIPTPATGLAGKTLKLLPMDVVDAERLDSEPAGEDGTCGKEQ